jgi:hypothetical protein
VIAGQVQVHGTAYQMANNASPGRGGGAGLPAVTVPIHEHARSWSSSRAQRRVNSAAGRSSRLGAVGGREPLEPPKAPTRADHRGLRRRLLARAARGLRRRRAARRARLPVLELSSPRSNRRTDEYGGSFENRLRFCIES